MGYFLIDGLWEAWYKSLKVRPHIRIKTAEALWASSTRSYPSLRGTDQTDRWIDLWRESLIVAGLQVVTGFTGVCPNYSLVSYLSSYSGAIAVTSGYAQAIEIRLLMAVGFGVFAKKMSERAFHCSFGLPQQLCRD